MTEFQLNHSGSGITANQINAMLDGFEAHQLRVHEIVIRRRDEPVLAASWAPYDAHLPQALFSLSKTFTSVAVGFAVQEGWFSVDDLVKQFFLDIIPDSLDPHYDTMTVKHLLTMNTGHETEPSIEGQGQSSEALFLSAPVEHTPGTFFRYNTPATYMLSAILQRVTGETVEAFLKPRLLEPLGIDADFSFASTPAGVNYGGFGARLTVQGIATFGEFLRHEGRIGDQQCLDPKWIKDMHTAWSDNAATGGRGDWGAGYGYQIWRCVPEGVYRGDGAFGQYCIVCPKQEMVIAVLSSTDQIHEILNVLWDHILSPLDQGTDDTSEGVEQLRQRLSALTVTPRWEGKDLSPTLQKAIDGQLPKSAKYQFADAPYRVKAVSVPEHPLAADWHFDVDGYEWVLPHGDGWQVSTYYGSSPDPKHWQGTDQFPVRIRWYGDTAHSAVALEVVWLGTTVHERWVFSEGENGTLLWTVHKQGTFDAGVTQYIGSVIQAD